MLPPPINSRPAKWMHLHEIEAVVGMAFDELNLTLPNKAPLFTFSYRRLEKNRWVLMHGNEVVTDRGNPIIANDSILTATVRPDVAIVNPEARTFYTCGQ